MELIQRTLFDLGLIPCDPYFKARMKLEALWMAWEGERAPIEYEQGWHVQLGTAHHFGDDGTRFLGISVESACLQIALILKGIRARPFAPRKRNARTKTGRLLVALGVEDKAGLVPTE